MPAERVSMQREREMLRLKYEAGASDRAIVRSIGVARSTVRLCLDWVAGAGLAWPLQGARPSRSLPQCRLFQPTRTLAVHGREDLRS